RPAQPVHARPIRIPAIRNARVTLRDSPVASQQPNCKTQPLAESYTEIYKLAAQGRGPRMTATPAVGRKAELDQLGRHLERVLHGQSATCFVTGEPGAGKSSLAMEFARRAQQRAPDLIVAVGTCDAYTGTGDAYLPFRDVLQQLTGDVERSLASGRTTHEG